MASPRQISSSLLSTPRCSVANARKAAAANLSSSLAACAVPSQTVENFFDYAFLIKEQSTSQKIDKATGLPVIKPAHREMLAEKESKQLVLQVIILTK